jgi:hypothetical protein
MTRICTRYKAAIEGNKDRLFRSINKRILKEFSGKYLFVNKAKRALIMDLKYKLQTCIIFGNTELPFAELVSYHMMVYFLILYVNHNRSFEKQAEKRAYD